MRKIFLIFFPILLLAFQASGQGAGKGASKKWLTLTTEEYSIQYPADWEIDESGNMGTKFYLFSPVTSDQDQLRENVNLLTQDLSEYKMTLDEFTEDHAGMFRVGRVMHQAVIPVITGAFLAALQAAQEACRTL